MKKIIIISIVEQSYRRNDRDDGNLRENQQRLSHSSRKREIQSFDGSKVMIPPRNMNFTSINESSESSKFTKKEIKEEIKHEVEKEEISQQESQNQEFNPIRNPENVEMQPNYENDEDEPQESSKSEDFKDEQNSSSEEEIMAPENQPQIRENPEPEIDLLVETRISRPIPSNGVPTVNSLHTRGEINSSVDALSNTIPNLPNLTDFDSNNPPVSNRRFLNQYIHSDSLESGEDLPGDRTQHRDLLETQIESLKASFVHTISQERQVILTGKKSLQKAIKQFEQKRQEFDTIQMEKEICRENKKRILKLQKDSDDIIDLDIGGTHHITTTRSTLCKFRNSVLAAMF